MPNPAKYIIKLLLLLCSLQSNAQREIEWYEPDFDADYAKHVLLYSDGISVVHYNGFYSRTAHSRKIKAVIKTSRDDLPSRYYVSKTTFDRDGYITGYRQFRHYTDGKIDTVQMRNYACTRKNGRLIAKETNNFFLKNTATFYFSRSKRLDSTTGNKFPTVCYKYDMQGRLTLVAPRNKTNGELDRQSATEIIFTDLTDVTAICEELRKLEGLTPLIETLTSGDCASLKAFKIDFVTPRHSYSEDKTTVVIAEASNALFAKKDFFRKTSHSDQRSLMLMQKKRLALLVHQNIYRNWGLLSGIDSSSTIATRQGDKWVYKELYSYNNNKQEEHIFNHVLPEKVEMKNVVLKYEYEFYK